MFLLEPVGLGRVENDVYLALGDLRQADADTIATRLDVSGRAVRTALARLVAAGLAHDLGDTPPTYMAVPPEVGVSAMVDRRRGDLARLQVELEDLAARLRRDRSAGDALLEMVVGDEAVIATVSRLQLEARTELLAVDVPPYAAGPSDPNDIQLARLADGIAYRAIYSPEALATPDQVRYMRRSIDAGEQARILPDVRTKLFVVDRRVAAIPVSYDPVDPAKRLIVRAPALVQLIVEQFESLWARAAPVDLDLDLDGEPAVTARDREMLALLAAGMKDITIARTLGVTDRTVGRRVTELMRVLGAETRFQAGILAARRGWL